MAFKKTCQQKTGAPEHELRGSINHCSDGELHEEIEAAYNYVDSVLETSEFDDPYYLWAGWSIREAFLAGITHARQQEQPNEQ